MIIDYSKITSEIVITIHLVLDTAIRIGGMDPDREEVLKIDHAAGLSPLIKDSSVKGVLRSEFQRLESVSLNPVQCQVKGYGNTELKWSEILFGVADLKSGSEERFSIRGALTISDMVLERAGTETRPHVRIRSKTRTAEDGGLFTQEVVSPGAIGILTIKILNILDMKPLKLLFFLLDEIASGLIHVGGNATGGLGRFRAEKLNVKVLRTSQELIGFTKPLTVEPEKLIDALAMID